MNALIAHRVNATGTLSPTPAMRAQVVEQLRSRIEIRVSAGVPAVKTMQKSDVGTRTIEQDLDRDAFLRLLVLQLQHQDPLQPMDNQEMLAQLAQFSALEQMNHLNDQFENFSGNVDQLNFVAAAGLVGQEVVGIDMTGEAVSGVVSSVHQDGSMIYLTVDGRVMAMAGVVSIGSNHGQSDST